MMGERSGATVMGGPKPAIALRFRPGWTLIAADFDASEWPGRPGGAAWDTVGRKVRVATMPILVWSLGSLPSTVPRQRSVLPGRSADGDEDVRGGSGVQPPEHGIKLSIG